MRIRKPGMKWEAWQLGAKRYEEAQHNPHLYRAAGVDIQ